METIKEHLWSAFITFLATFVAVMASQFDNLSAMVETGALAGLIMVAVRAAVKVTAAYLLAKMK